MPTVGVKRATELRDGGAADGREIAVAGYFDEESIHCFSTAFGPYDLPLESSCRAAAFADTIKDAHACVSRPHGVTRCALATSPTPVFVNDTIGVGARLGASSEPQPIVVVGHFADPRFYQCIPTFQATCAHQFVADAITWADGHPVEPVAPSTYDSQGQGLSLRLSLDGLRNAIAPDQTIVSAGASPARDARRLDPRWNRPGDNILWSVRSVASDPSSEIARDVTVWLVDDATGTVLDSRPLTLPSDYAPAIVWFRGEHHGLDESQDDWANVATEIHVSSASGADIWEGTIGGSTTGTGDTTINGPDVPLVLDPGPFSFVASTGGVDGSPIPGAFGDCSMTHSFSPLEQVRFVVDFPMGQHCTWSAAQIPNF